MTVRELLAVLGAMEPDLPVYREDVEHPDVSVQTVTVHPADPEHLYWREHLPRRVLLG